MTLRCLCQLVICWQLVSWSFCLFVYLLVVCWQLVGRLFAGSQLVGCLPVVSWLVVCRSQLVSCKLFAGSQLVSCLLVVSWLVVCWQLVGQLFASSQSVGCLPVVSQSVVCLWLVGWLFASVQSVGCLPVVSWSVVWQSVGPLFASRASNLRRKFFFD